jgi:hypothetical protein
MRQKRRGAVAALEYASSPEEDAVSAVRARFSLPNSIAS